MYIVINVYYFTAIFDRHTKMIVKIEVK